MYVYAYVVCRSEDNLKSLFFGPSDQTQTIWLVGDHHYPL